MTMQSVSLAALDASAANPRRKFDRKTIEGLAASIRTDGLLHNRPGVALGVERGTPIISSGTVPFDRGG
jgi:hypothetical protein